MRARTPILWGRIRRLCGGTFLDRSCVDRWTALIPSPPYFSSSHAHRLIWLADTEGVQDAVVEALFRAYFTDGRDISDRQTLRDVAAKAGLDRATAEGVLTSGSGQEAIREADELARRVRVEGVPFFVINGKITLSGAQPPEAFLAAFKQAVGT